MSLRTDDLCQLAILPAVLRFAFYQCLDIKLDFTCGRNQIVHHMGEKPTKEALGPRNED